MPDFGLLRTLEIDHVFGTASRRLAKPTDTRTDTKKAGHLGIAPRREESRGAIPLSSLEIQPKKKRGAEIPRWVYIVAVGSQDGNSKVRISYMADRSEAEG